MKVNTIIITTCLLLFQTALIAQIDTNIFLKVFTNQKEYVNNNIRDKEKSKYLSLIHFANILHPRVNKEIQRINSSFLNSIQGLNILEYFSNYNNVNGIVWKGDIYYSFEYGSDKKLIVNQRSYAQLNDSMRAILSNFNNWNHSTFATNGLSLGSPTDHPFFLTSKILGESIETIGFYYP